MPENIIKIQSLPGIKRDGTRFEGDQYVDGQWVRFQRGLPRKIGGYRTINKYLSEISRSLIGYSEDDLTYVHSGSANKVERFYIDQNNNTSVISDRTPLTGFTPDANNMWQFEVRHPFGVGETTKLVAQVSTNLASIVNNATGALFYGDLIGTAPLVPITLPLDGVADGGVVALGPYLFFFGSGGYVGWSVPGSVTDLTGSGSGAVNVTGQKIVQGKPLRGGAGNSPSGLFWSADSLIRASFVGGATVFQFDTLSSESSILGANTVIEYDGIFYWCGVDRFLSFNGVVREVPNTLNVNYFFDGLNNAYRQKVFAFKVPRFGEIWWCYPRGDATECSHAVIFNVRENTWYDCELPNGGRSAATSPSVYRFPLATGVVPDASAIEFRVTEAGDFRITEDGDSRVTEESQLDGFKLWVQEIGVDSIDGIDVQPVLSYFETADISLPVQSQVNKAIQVLMIEPDFVQSGDMTLEVHGRANARAPEVESTPLTFPDVEGILTPQQQVLYLKEQRRELRFRFTSNAIGGDYQMGLVLAHIQPGDGTVIG
jgi:hypothetical protein